MELEDLRKRACVDHQCYVALQDCMAKKRGLDSQVGSIPNTDSLEQVVVKPEPSISEPEGPFHSSVARGSASIIDMLDHEQMMVKTEPSISEPEDTFHSSVATGSASIIDMLDHEQMMVKTEPFISGPDEGFYPSLNPRIAPIDKEYLLLDSGELVPLNNDESDLLNTSGQYTMSPKMSTGEVLDDDPVSKVDHVINKEQHSDLAISWDSVEKSSHKSLGILDYRLNSPFSALSGEVFQYLLFVNRCPYCNDYTQNVVSLFEHLSECHQSRSSFQCPDTNCGLVYKSLSFLLDHLVQVHSLELQLGCIVCGAKCDSLELAKSHLDEHAVACLICGIDFEESHFLADHMADKHMNESKKLFCQFCNSQVDKRTPIVFVQHIREHYGMAKYRCKFCGQWFETRKSLLTHLNAAHKSSCYLRCPLCTKFCSKSTLHMVVHWSNGCGRLRCELCKTAFFSTLSTLYSHRSKCGKASHPFRCDICSARFSAKHHLMSHTVSRHDKSKGFPCLKEGCKFIACSKQTFEQHIFKIHDISVGVSSANQSNGEKVTYLNAVLRCRFPSCNFRTSKKNILEDHVESDHASIPYRLLPANKKFLCVLCGYLFRDKHALKRHTISAHGAESEHFCTTCNVYFANNYYYQIHMQQSHVKLSGTDEEDPDDATTVSNGTVSKKRSSSPLKCDKCSYYTHSCLLFQKHKASLLHKGKNSSRNRTTYKPKKCPLCDYVTGHNSCSRPLERHLFVHYRRGEKIPDGFKVSVHRCGLCEHVTCDESHLRRHYKVHIKRGDTLPPPYDSLSK
ncbi:zinc finger protein 93-like [Watersipora subatra]|uniref:zinc finger protein 93-like n=1 Tax=Watersipora subatra TaxID=2589382 RepID=UPI00355C1313